MGAAASPRPSRWIGHALRGIPEVESVNDFGQLQEVRLKGDPQKFLQHLSTRSTVYQFEVTRPSLQDIFVRIAKPAEQELGAGTSSL